MTIRVVATAGHVDHGKSTLVHALTGTDPDRLAEEKRRGLTIELGFANVRTAAGIDLHFVDVPGHVRFIKTMLAGVGAVDACLLLVAATEGWKAQTEEHLRILDLLGIRAGLVVVTMADRVDPDHLALALLDVADHTAGTFLEAAEVTAVDSLTGRGLDALRAALDRLAAASPGHPDDGRARLWIDRSFSLPGAGTVVTGTLTGGALVVDDQVELLTRRGTRSARVRGLQSFGVSHPRLEPGCRAAVSLAGVHHRDLGRGDALVLPGAWHHTPVVDASFTALASAVSALRSGGAPIAYLGSGEHTVGVRVLGTGAIEAGATGAVRLRLPRPLPLLPGDRYVLRDTGTGTTIGGGEVLDVAPVLRPSHARPDRSVDRVVAERGWVEANELERLTGERRPPTLGRWVVDPTALEARRRSLDDRVQAAGPLGLDVAALDERDRALLDVTPGVVVDAGRARPATAGDPHATHPYLAILAGAPYAPPQPEEAGVPASDVAELVRRGLAVREGGIVFSATAVEGAVHVVRSLLAAAPEGFTVSGFRAALGTSRRFAVPLLTQLDRSGVTRRRGEVRVAGPRLGSAAP